MHGRWTSRGLFFALAALVMVAACETVPYTGRSQLQLISAEQETQMGAQTYTQTLAKEKLSTDPVATEMVKAVGSLLGAGAAVGVLLPWSRQQESEADHLGLILMAKAGYVPHAARDLWVRMGQQKGASQPEFLSTHPSDPTRVRQIEGWLPEALQYYKSR